jgi:hypothetical protein
VHLQPPLLVLLPLAAVQAMQAVALLVVLRLWAGPLHQTSTAV